MKINNIILVLRTRIILLSSFVIYFFCICHSGRFPIIDTLSYNRMTASIPKLWKEILKLRMNPVTIHKTTTVRARGILKDVTKVINKALNWIAIDKIFKEPTVIETWIVSYPFLANASWHKIFKLTHRISPEPYLHSFQCKIVNRIL